MSCVLIVDDEPQVRAFAREALELLGYDALETGDPQEALRIVRERHVDLLLTDVVMPLMRGTELADRIQATSGSTKALLMSGYITSDVTPSGRPFLAKPFTVESLAETVRDALTRPSVFTRSPQLRSCYPDGPPPRQRPDGRSALPRKA